MSRILILCILIGIPAACGESYPTIPDQSLEKGASIRMGNFYRESLTTEGKKAWDLQAEEAYIYRRNRQISSIIAYNFHFRQYDEREKVIARIQAIRGEIDYNNNILYLTGDVVYSGSSHRTIESDKMEFDRESGIIRSQLPVTIRDRGLYTHCSRGIEVDQKNERQICKGSAGVHSRRPSSDGGVDDIFQ